MFSGDIYGIVDVYEGEMLDGTEDSSIKRGVFKSGPRKGQPYCKNAKGQFAKCPDGNKGSSSASLKQGSDISTCEESFDMTFALSAYGEIGVVVGKDRVTGNIGECSLKEGCHWTLTVENEWEWGAAVGVRVGILGSATATASIVVPLF